VQNRLARLEGAYEQVDNRLGDLRQDVLGFRQEMGQRFNAVDQKFTAMFGLIVGTWITTILAILFHR
jgi:tetrahydromethanopterin S-methyltransferase subunit G